jgi:hypothetical protein
LLILSRSDGTLVCFVLNLDSHPVTDSSEKRHALAPAAVIAPPATAPKTIDGVMPRRPLDGRPLVLVGIIGYLLKRGIIEGVGNVGKHGSGGKHDRDSIRALTRVVSIGRGVESVHNALENLQWGVSNRPVPAHVILNPSQDFGDTRVPVIEQINPVKFAQSMARHFAIIETSGNQIDL